MSKKSLVRISSTCSGVNTFGFLTDPLELAYAGHRHVHIRLIFAADTDRAVAADDAYGKSGFYVCDIAVERTEELQHEIERKLREGFFVHYGYSEHNRFYRVVFYHSFGGLSKYILKNLIFYSENCIIP